MVYPAQPEEEVGPQCLPSGGGDLVEGEGDCSQRHKDLVWYQSHDSDRSQEVSIHLYALTHERTKVVHVMLDGDGNDRMVLISMALLDTMSCQDGVVEDRSIEDIGSLMTACRRPFLLMPWAQAVDLATERRSAIRHLLSRFHTFTKPTPTESTLLLFASTGCRRARTEFERGRCASTPFTLFSPPLSTRPTTARRWVRRSFDGRVFKKVRYMCSWAWDIVTALELPFTWCTLDLFVLLFTIFVGWGISR